MRFGRPLFSGLLALALAAAGAPAAAAISVARPAAGGADDLELGAQLDASGALQKAAAQANARVKLPTPVTLRYASCDGPNAWYRPELREVQLCLSLARHLAALLAPQLDDEAQMLEALDGALRFIALHELGHALVDVLQLPITGREEDAVDQFAVWLMLDAGDSTGVLSAASVFASEVSGGSDLAASHSLDRQRYFSILCWVYGRDPAWREALVEDWALPAERARYCIDEYAQIGRSWTRLLARHAPRRAEAPPSGSPSAPPAGSERKTVLKTDPAVAAPASASASEIEFESESESESETETETETAVPPDPPPGR